MLVSMSMTLAPKPRAIWAALEPTMPAPIMVTVPGGDSGNTGKQLADAAVLLFEVVGTDLDGNPAGDFAHGGEEREATVLILDGFVGEGGNAVLEEGPGELGVGGEVEVGEEDDAGTEHIVLGFEGFLDLDDHVGGPKDVLRVLDDGGAPAPVFIVGKAAAHSGVVLDEKRGGNVGRGR